MTVLKSRKTSAVYIGDEGSIYAARQGMRACNNNNMRNTPTSFIMALHMLVLLHALIPCLAAYILPSSPVLLYIYCTCFPTF